MMMNKKGVALVTVLLFMLVATIAATATYKWLSSENRTSGTRMMQNEARMAAIAGVESARSWFTHHGNETGAVIKQYLQKKTPINLDGQLVAVGNGAQGYSVSVTDVDVSETPYKVKVVSVGESRNGSKYSETAVFKINGLYSVQKPSRPATSDYDYAYFGGTTNFDGGHSATSLLINGNWSGNPGSVSRDFIVTGTTTLSGDNIFVGGTSCLGGATSVQNGFITKDLFVDGNVSSMNGTITGNAYFNKNVSFGSVSNKSTTNGNYGGFRVGGSMTLNGSMQTNQSTFDYNIGKNMCLGNTDAAKLTFSHSPSKFIVEQDVWVPKRTAMSGIRNFGEYSKVVLGNKEDSKVYVQKTKKCTDDNVVSYKINYPHFNLDLHRTTDYGSLYQFANCPSDMYYQKGDEGNFKEYVDASTKLAYVENYAQFTTKSANLTKEISDPSEQLVTCAEPVKEYCDNIWVKQKGCSAESEYFVPDMLTTSYAQFKTFAAKSSCSKDITTLSNQSISKMNACYRSLKSDPSKKDTELFNGYLVLNLTPDFNAANGITDSLDGKFILVYDNQLGQFALPMTTSTSSVFLYLKEGASSTIDCKCPANGKNCKTEANHNYFIFANKSMNGLLGSCLYSGSVYAVAANCAGIGSVNGSVDMEYNPTVVNDLTASGVICKAGTTCNGTVSASTSESTSGSGSEGVIPDYIAVGTNLTVELESQYKTTETVARSTPVEPSIVVLPRVVYLNDDAVGSLRDYFSPVPLNGARVLGNGQLSCPTYARLTNATLATEDDPLDQGDTYTCTYSNSADNQSYSSEFYVVVKGNTNTIPNIGFVGNSSVPLSSTGDMTTDVYLNVGAVKSSAGEFSIDIVLTGNVGWNITSHIGNAVSTSSSEIRYHYDGLKSSTATQVKLFTVTTTSSSTKGDLWFMLENPEDCVPVNPVKVLTIRGEAYVTRGTINDFCTVHGDDNYCQNKEYCQGRSGCNSLSDFDKIPSCYDFISSNFGSDYEWVKAFGDDCEVSNPKATNTNKKWKCFTGSAINLVIQNASSLSDYCDFYLPSGSNNEITTFSGSINKSLYAEAKRKGKTLTVNMVDHGSGSATIYFSSKAYSSNNELNSAVNRGEITSSNIKTCANSQCTYSVYAGDHVYLRGNSGSGTNASKFSVWKHYEGNPAVLTTDTDNPFHVLVQGDTTVYAYFNERDSHCFYDDLQSVAVFCDDNSCPSGKNACNCVDRCTSEDHCSVLSEHKYSSANWVLVYKNGSSWKTLLHDNGLTGLGRIDGLWTSEKGKNERDGKESVVLGYAESGSNGSFTASFKTGNITEKDNEHYLNSGFILRSDERANKYLTLSFYGRNAFGTTLAALGVFARVCYNEGKTLTTNEKCVEKELKDKYDHSIGLAYGVTLSMEAVANGNVLDVNFSYQGSSSTWNVSGVSFDLTDSRLATLNTTELDRNTYKYVGLKLSDESFKVISAAWRSYDFNDCWDTPFTTCSFADAYAGGRVPLNQNAMPWVGVSNWFADKSCSIKYYYNGCDMNTDVNRYESSISTWINSVAAGISGASCPADDPSADGYFWGTSDGGKNGAALKEDKTYNFTYEGLHGEVKETPSSITYPTEGIVRNASVLVDCDGVARNYVANCGTFWVGNMHECTNSEFFIWGPYATPIEVSASAASTPYHYDFTDVNGVSRSANLRSASLWITLETASTSQEVLLYLKDKNGRNSKSISIKAVSNPYGGMYAGYGTSVDVNGIIDAAGFNPEEVVGIVFVSNDYYKISALWSFCSNAATASCSDANYNAERKELTLYGSATSGQQCKIQICKDADCSEKSVSCASSPFIATDVRPGVDVVQGEEYTVKLKVVGATYSTYMGTMENTAVCDPGVTKVLYEGASGGDTPTPSTQTAICQATRLSNGSYKYEVTAQNCDGNCKVSVMKGDALTSYGSSSVSTTFDETISEDGTYYVFFNDDKTNALTGCDGFTVSMVDADEECGCESTCGSLCNNIQVGSNVGVEGTSHSAQCFFGTSVVAINRNYDKNTIVINGVNYPDNKACDNTNDCSANIKDFPVKNGGYFMLVPKSAGNVVDGNYYEWIKARVTGATAVPAACRTSTDPSDETLLSEQTVSITKGHDQIERGGYGDRPMIDLKSGEILALEKTTDVIRIGCWGEQGTRYVKVQDCSNVVSTHTLYCGDWNDLGISGKCTIYIQAIDNDLNFKFGAWGY